MDVTQISGPFSIGVDVGGTFSDVVIAYDGGVWRAKAPTSQGEFGRGVLAGLELAAVQSGRPIAALLAEVEWFGLSTTAVTNVIAELRGASVGLLTTAGFEYELNLATGIRFCVDGPVQAPPQIVPQSAIIGVRERIDRDGAVIEPLDTQAAVDAVRRLREGGRIDCLAISFVNAYRNSAHEEQAAAAVRQAFPDLALVWGAQLDPGFGFLQRTMSAVLNAFSIRAFDGVDEFAQRLRGLGLRVAPRLIDSTGGAIGIAGARAKPLTLMQSGPAAGVAATAALGRQLGLDRVLACDMGGTSFDISVIDDHSPLRRLNAEILRVPTGLSMVDVDSIGSGGGSIAWADSRGMLRVGPRSSGSIPGPACYGRGGQDATVTDALLVLGFLDPGTFLGGSMRLDLEAATRACERLGSKLGLTAIDTAWGIRRIALADMTRTTRTILSRRGLDPMDYTIVSYGGCGSLFNAEIAAELGIVRVVVPPVASVFSAFGAATAPVRRERAVAIVRGLPLDGALLVETMGKLRAVIDEDLASDSVPAAQRSISFEAALRFKRQITELPLAIRAHWDPEQLSAHLAQAFADEYARRYGGSALSAQAPIELVTLRAIGVGRVRAPPCPAAGATPASLLTTSSVRKLWLDPAASTAVAAFDSAQLRAGGRIDGPALIDGTDTTIWIPAQASAVVGADLTLSITRHPTCDC